MAEKARLIGRAHGELVKVELAEHARACVPQLARHGRFVLRHKAFEDVAGRRRLHVFGRKQILHANRHAGKRLEAARSAVLVGLIGRGQRDFRGFDDEGIERLCAGDSLVEGGGNISRGEVARFEAVADGSNAKVS